MSYELHLVGSYVELPEREVYLVLCVASNLSFSFFSSRLGDALGCLPVLQLLAFTLIRPVCFCFMIMNYLNSC